MLEGMDAPAEGPPEPAAYCPVARRVTSAEECRRYTLIKANAQTGLGAVKFPPSITRGETRKVSFVISGAAPGEGATTAQLLGSAPSDEFKLKVTGRMGARLQGEGFKISPGERVDHDIGITDSARWDWDVTALKAPHHKLTLTAYMIVEKPDGSQSEEALPSIEREIPVKVTVAQSFSDFVEGLVSISDSAKILIGALTALLVALLAFKSKVAELLGPLFGRKPTPPEKQA
jgi:hypothetical protein